MLVKTITQTVKIGGMMCEHCAMRVRTLFEDVKGVKKVVVSHVEGTAIIASQKGLDINLIKATVEKAGYKFLGVE